MINLALPIIDTNLLIPFFAQEKPFDEVKKILQNGVYINDYIVCETLNFLQNKYSVNASMVAQKFLFQKSDIFNFLHIDGDIRRLASVIRVKFADNKFSFTDSLMLAQAQIYDLKVLTQEWSMQNYKPVRVENPLV